MKIYKISQKENNSYDTYDSCVVFAENEEEAKNMNPDGKWNKSYSGWCSSPDKVTVEYLGIADSTKEKGFIVKSFNAG